jgi:hypothetical protein
VEQELITLPEHMSSPPAQLPKEEEQTTQWPKEEEQTTQWPRCIGQFGS